MISLLRTSLTLTQIACRSITNTSIAPVSITHPIRYRFSRGFSAAADNLFKQYYSRRLSLPPQELQQYLARLAAHPFNQQDHRWVSLAHSLQTHITKFNPNKQAYMLKTLINIGSKDQLVQTLTKQLVKQIDILNFQQTTVLLWCIAKINDKPKYINALTQIYQRLSSTLKTQNESPTITIRQREEEQTEQQATGQTVVINATSLSMVLSSMATLGITDKFLMKKLIQVGVRPNLHVFSPTTLCTFLVAFERLGLRNKRDTLEVYKTIRSKPNQVEQMSIETLLNLAFCVANLSQRDPSQQDRGRIEKHRNEVQKLQAEQNDMKKFFGWICETILLRQPNLHCSKSALMLLYAQKIMYFHQETWLAASKIITTNILEAKVVDLVMALKALTSLNKDKREILQNQETIISSRLWQLQSSITSKSLHTLALLHKNKKIKPPASFAKILTQHLIELQSSKYPSNSTPNTSHPSTSTSNPNQSTYPSKPNTPHKQKPARTQSSFKK